MLAGQEEVQKKRRTKKNELDTVMGRRGRTRRQVAVTQKRVQRKQQKQQTQNNIKLRNKSTGADELTKSMGMMGVREFKDPVLHNGGNRDELLVSDDEDELLLRGNMRLLAELRAYGIHVLASEPIPLALRDIDNFDALLKLVGHVYRDNNHEHDCRQCTKSHAHVKTKLKHIDDHYRKDTCTIESGRESCPDCHLWAKVLCRHALKCGQDPVECFVPLCTDIRRMIGKLPPKMKRSDRQ